MVSMKITTINLNPVQVIYDIDYDEIQFIHNQGININKILHDFEFNWRNIIIFTIVMTIM